MKKNPRVAFNSMIKRKGGFNLKEKDAIRSLGGWICSRSGHREMVELQIWPVVPVPVRTVNSRGTIWRGKMLREIKMDGNPR